MHQHHNTSISKGQQKNPRLVIDTIGENYRYIDNLDSTRYKKNNRLEHLWSKCQIMYAIIFGRGITLSSNQFIDSQGAIQLTSELLDASQSTGFVIPVRLSLRDQDWNPYEMLSKAFGRINGKNDPERYFLSSWPTLDNDPERRELLKNAYLKGDRCIEEIFRSNQFSDVREQLEQQYRNLRFINQYPTQKIHADVFIKNFIEEINSIIMLNENRFFSNQNDTIIDLSNPIYFLSDGVNDEKLREAGLEIVNSLKQFKDKFKDKSGDGRKGRSIYHSQSEEINSDKYVIEGVHELVDNLYNWVNAQATISKSPLSDNTATPAYPHSIYQRAGYRLATWARFTLTQGKQTQPVLRDNSELIITKFEKSVDIKDETIISNIKRLKFDDLLKLYKYPEWLSHLKEYINCDPNNKLKKNLLFQEHISLTSQYDLGLDYSLSKDQEISIKYFTIDDNKKSMVKYSDHEHDLNDQMIKINLDVIQGIIHAIR